MGDPQPVESNLINGHEKTQQPLTPNISNNRDNPLASSIPDRADNIRLLLQDLISPKLNDQISQIQELTLKEKSKSLTDIYFSGTLEEKRWLNELLFVTAEKTEDKDLREKLHRFHFRIAVNTTEESQVISSQNLGKEFPLKCVITGLINNNAELIKSLIGNEEPNKLILDYSKFENDFIQFCEEFHNRKINQGVPILDKGSSPADLSAVIKSIHVELLNFFGYINTKTAVGNRRKYLTKGNVSLSELKSDNKLSTATCTEFSALSHQFLSLTGLVRSKMINGGILNVFEPDGTFNDDLLDSQHNYLVLFYGSGQSERIFLYDPANYERRTDIQRNATYFWPHIEEVTSQQYHDFIQSSKPISIDRSLHTTDYYIS